MAELRALVTMCISRCTQVLFHVGPHILEFTFEGLRWRSIVSLQVTRLKPEAAVVDILCVGELALHTKFQGQIRYAATVASWWAAGAEQRVLFWFDSFVQGTFLPLLYGEPYWFICFHKQNTGCEGKGNRQGVLYADGDACRIQCCCIVWSLFLLSMHVWCFRTLGVLAIVL